MEFVKFSDSNRIWSSRQSSSKYNEKDSVGQILFQTLSSSDPSKIIQINDMEETTFTIGDILEISQKLANHLLDINIQQTDIIGIMAAGSSYVMPVCYAALFIGSPFFCMEISLDKESILRLWNIIKPKVIFCDDGFYNLTKEVTSKLYLNCKIYTLKHQVENILKDRSTNHLSFQPLDVDDLDKTVMLCCSSGSSGLQKAVCWSHRFTKEYCLPML